MDRILSAVIAALSAVGVVFTLVSAAVCAGKGQRQGAGVFLGLAGVSAIVLARQLRGFGSRRERPPPRRVQSAPPPEAPPEVVVLAPIPPEELPRRRKAWGALSDLFLDTEPDESDREWIAHRLLQSGYTDEALVRILEDEVTPVLTFDLRAWIAGAVQWGGYDEEWLARTILENVARGRTERRPGYRPDLAPILQVLQRLRATSPGAR